MPYQTVIDWSEWPSEAHPSMTNGAYLVMDVEEDIRKAYFMAGSWFITNGPYSPTEIRVLRFAHPHDITSREADK